MRVSEIMTDKPIATTPRASIGDALELMYAHDVRHLPVIDDERLVGMISDRDLRGLFVPDAEIEGLFDTSRLEMLVADLMSANPLAVQRDGEIDDVIELLLEHKIGAVPVVNPRDDILVGIVSYTDILRGAIGRL